MPVRIAAATLVLLLASGTSRADAPATNDTVPISESFSRLELALTAAAAAGGIFAMGGLPSLIDTTPSLGPPAPGSFDRRVSDAFHRDDGSGHRFLWRAPDLAGLYVLPYLPALTYAAEAVWAGRGTGPLLPTSNTNPNHRLLAYAGALGWTALITGVTKVVVGRTRPYAVLDRPELAGPASERELSFFSGHSAAMFCAASFVALDVGDALRYRTLAAASPLKRLLLATVVPYATAYGLATLVAVSRIIDQQHWASDVLIGAAMGAAAGHLAYLTHFDSRGRPRRRNVDEDARSMALRVMPAPGGLALVGRF